MTENEKLAAHLDSYKSGFNHSTAMATRACELTMRHFTESDQGLAALKLFMAYMFSGHHYHLPTTYKDAGLAIVHGLMRLAGFGGTYFMYDADAVRNWDELEIQ